MRREEEEGNRRGNGRKEVKKLAAGERNTQHRCYRHEDEKLPPGAELLTWLRGGKGVIRR